MGVAVTVTCQTVALDDDDAGDAPPLLGLIDRVLALLESLGTASGPRTLSEISRRTGIPLSSAHRLLATLVARGVVERCERCYTLGPRMAWMGEQQSELADRRLCRISRSHLP